MYECVSPHRFYLHFFPQYSVFQKYISLHKVQEHTVRTETVALFATNQNQTWTVISSGSTTFYMSTSLIQLLFDHGTENWQHTPCVLIVVTELTDLRLSGPVVDLSLYNCSTRRKIPVRSLVLPISVVLQHLQGKVCHYFLSLFFLSKHSKSCND